MALKNFKLCISNDGIKPNMITNAGTQGDHGVTCLEFELSDELYNYFVQKLVDQKITYRFDIYNGAGGIWKSDVFELTSSNISLTLEERHTRYGGKVIVYVVIAALSVDNKTEIELYNSPLVVCLENRPDGIYRQEENYESLASIAENVKSRAEQVSTLAANVEEKLKNGEFDGVGVEKTEISNDNLIITYTNGKKCSLGNVKGEKGDRGEKGDTGENGKDAITDQIYSPESENAQSGVAVAKALENYCTKEDLGGICSNYDGRFAQLDSDISSIETRLHIDYYKKTEVENLVADAVAYTAEVEKKAISTSLALMSNYYQKADINALVGDIESLLGGI